MHARLPPTGKSTTGVAAPLAGRRGILFILSAPSGAGKDSLITGLNPSEVGLERVVSYTTRPPRPDETNGVHYRFVDEQTMRAMLAAGDLVECTEFIPGRLYGTPRRAVDDALAAGRDVLIKPEVLGAAKVKAVYPEAVMIFLAPPSPEEAARRMHERQSETPAEARARIEAMPREFAAAARYDYIVVNETGRLADAVARVSEIVAGERRKRG